MERLLYKGKGMENGEEIHKENNSSPAVCRCGCRPYGLWIRDFRETDHPCLPRTVGNTSRAHWIACI